MDREVTGKLSVKILHVYQNYRDIVIVVDY